MSATFRVYASQGLVALEDQLPAREFVTYVDRDGDWLTVAMSNPGTRADGLVNLALACRRILMDAGLHHCALGVVDRATLEDQHREAA
jgi:hypothetical protein